MTFHVTRDSEHRRNPWRNGGGVTAELASSPPGAGAGEDFDWRVSMADVTQSGPFSRFEGVDRVIMLVDGPPLTLRHAGGTTVLRPFEPYVFDGGDDVVCEVAGPSRDLNVMTRRGRAVTEVAVVHIGADAPVEVAPAKPVVVVCVSGSTSVSSPEVVSALGVGDVVIADEPMVLHGTGRVAVVRLSAPLP